jgi:hypothetical protein
MRTCNLSQVLPELVNKLRQLVHSQFTEADRAICGRGDLKLSTAHATHRVSVDVWMRMTSQQRRKASQKCFRQLRVASATSTDGSLCIPTTPGAGKKPNQRKRQRTERTARNRRAEACHALSAEFDAFSSTPSSIHPISDHDYFCSI